MLESFPVSLLVGTVLGFLSGLGVGGGSLLILWLTLVLAMSPEEAQILNLLFFIPSALIACCFRWRQGQLDLKALIPAILCGCISAGVFSWVRTLLDVSLLKKLFGGLLILTGLRELFCKQKPEASK